MPGKEYDPETRAAVMSALLSGQGVNETSREYEIPKSTVSRWKTLAWEEAGRSDDVGELLLEYLTENLTTLRAQAERFRDPEWLERGYAPENSTHLECKFLQRSGGDSLRFEVCERGLIADG